MPLFDGRTIDSLTALQGNLRVWIIICGIVTCLALGSTLILNYLNHQAGSQIISLQRSQRETEMAQEQQELAEANARTHQAELAAQAANARAAKLAARTEPRKLTAEQIAAITQPLQNAPRAPVLIMCCSTAPEAVEFTKQLNGIFSGLGYSVGMSSLTGAVVAGLEIRVDNKPLDGLGAALDALMTAQGQNPSEIINSITQGPTQAMIMVGDKRIGN